MAADGKKCGSDPESHVELGPCDDTTKLKDSSTQVDGGGFDEALELCGSWGLWQKLVFFVSHVSQVFCSIHAVSSAFLSATPDHWCDVGVAAVGGDEGEDHWLTPELLKNISIPWSEDEGYSKCTYYVHNYTALSSASTPYDLDLPNATRTCSSWTFDTSVFQSTLVSEFSLVCERRWMMATVQASYMSGLLVGSVVMGHLSDRFGRRTMSLFCAVVAAVVAVCTAFVNTYSFFLLMRFIIAFLNAGLMVINFVLVAEVVSPSARTMCGMMYAFFFGSGIAILPGIAYFVRNWRDLQLVIGLLSSVLMSYYWLLPESPRWLASKGRVSEALQIMKRIAHTNGKTLLSDQHMMKLLSGGHPTNASDEEKPIGDTDNCSSNSAEGDSRRNSNARQGSGRSSWCMTPLSILRDQWTLVRTPIMRRRSLVMFFVWFVAASVYYGLIFSGGNIKADPFLMIFVSGMVELPSTVLFIYFLDRFGRRPTMCGLFLASGACCILVLAVPREMIYVNFCLVNLGKFFDTAVFQQAYLYTSELMPTPSRNVAVGTSSMIARVGCVITPYVIELLGDIHYAIPSTLFGILAIASGFLTLLLPETNKTRLPETVDEVEAMPT